MLYCLLTLSLFFPVMLTEGIGEGVEREDCVQALSGQIFMGMVSSQFQARLDTVRLIDALVTACIRFVYFSMEDELRSKVTTVKLLIITSLAYLAKIAPPLKFYGSLFPTVSFFFFWLFLGHFALQLHIFYKFICVYNITSPLQTCK